MCVGFFLLLASLVVKWHKVVLTWAFLFTICSNTCEAFFLFCFWWLSDQPNRSNETSNKLICRTNLTEMRICISLRALYPFSMLCLFFEVIDVFFSSSFKCTSRFVLFEKCKYLNVTWEVYKRIIIEQT